MRQLEKNQYKHFVQDIKQRIRQSQYDALKVVNKDLINLYWDIGKAIMEKQEKSGWGKSIVEELAKDIQKEFPGINGFLLKN